MRHTISEMRVKWTNFALFPPFIFRAPWMIYLYYLVLCHYVILMSNQNLMFVPLQLLCIVEEINYGNIYTMEIVISKGSQNLWPLFTPKVSWRQNAENCLIWLGVEACPGSRVSPNSLAWNTNEILGKCTYFFCDIELMGLFLHLRCYLFSFFWLISISWENNKKEFFIFFF